MPVPLLQARRKPGLYGFSHDFGYSDVIHQSNRVTVPLRHQSIRAVRKGLLNQVNRGDLSKHCQIIGIFTRYG
jgi:hypothetical protein